MTGSLINRFFAAPLALAFACLCLPAASAPGYKNFGVAVYVRAYEVREMKDQKLLEARWSAIEKQIKVSKVYLEVHRDGIVPDEEALAAAKKFFADRGIQTSGGIATVAAERNRFQTFCYLDPAERAKFKQIVEYAAKHFDEVILDDFFFTSCKTEAAIQAKGNKSWTRFRLDLMEDVAKNLVVAPARAVNPKVQLIIKYPNWYEHYQYLGYNVEAEPPLFDKVYTGTETRDPVYGGQHLQQYLGYDLVRWLENVKPGGNGGGWVDPGGMRTLNRYAEQLWITLFAKAPEITLFDYRSLLEPIRQEDGSLTQATEIGRVAGYTFEQVDGFIGKLGHPVGVKSYKPFHSSGEDFLNDYLGMAGIPIELVPQFPADSKTILLTEAAKFDAAIVEKIKRQLVAGKTVVITSGLLKALQGQGIEDIAEIECTAKKAVVRDFFSRFTSLKGNADILIPEIRYPTNDVWEVVGGLSQGNGYPILLQAGYASGTLYVLTIPDNMGDLYNLPAEVLTTIKEVLTRDLPVRVEAPAQVSLFVYDNNTFIVESFLDHFASVRVVADRKFTKLTDLKSAGGFFFPQGPPQVRGNSAVFDVFVGPNTYRVYQLEEEKK
jgi:hypothetical protein